MFNYVSRSGMGIEEILKNLRNKCCLPSVTAIDVLRPTVGFACSVAFVMNCYFRVTRAWIGMTHRPEALLQRCVRPYNRYILMWAHRSICCGTIILLLNLIMSFHFWMFVLYTDVLCNRSICVVISVWRETWIDYRYMRPQWLADVKFILLEVDVYLCYCVLWITNF